MRLSHPKPSRAILPTVTAALIAALAGFGCEEPTSSALTPTESEGVQNRSVEAATYRVTVTNDVASGQIQPFTPSVVTIHNPAVTVFEVGAPATEPVERVAESGGVPILVSALAGTNQVFDVGVAFGTVAGAPGPILPGASGSVEIHGPAGRGMRLSVVSMLVCTNDGITGLSAVDLPRKVGETLTYEANAYDAGTEQNTEAYTDLVPPCVALTTGAEGGTGADQPGIEEDDVIRHHPGIDSDPDGMDILDEDHQWSDPVATIEVERIN